MPILLDGNRIEEEPNLLFDKADTSAFDPQPYWGLRKFGPYDKEITKLRLGIISPKEEFQKVKSLIDDLNSGTRIFPGGMSQFFRCKIKVVKELTVDSPKVDQYEERSWDFIKSVDSKDVDVVIVYIPKTGRYFTDTPYYRVKAIFTSQGYSTQMVTYWTFENIKWSYVNLASALFAKAGGIPWVLESQMKNTDMILGISVSNLISYKSRVGILPRYVGYVNVFDEHGKWMFFEGTAKPYEKNLRRERLKELLESAVRKFRAMKKTYPKSLVIHSWKRISKEEIEIIDRNLDELVGEHNVAFVSIDDSHPFRLYDTGIDDGSFPRGHYTYLDENETLLSTTGATEVAGRRMGTPRPLHIRFTQKPSNFLSVDDITYQVFALTKLNWATVTPLIREPVTILFSREIAYLTAAISDSLWEKIMSPLISATLHNKTWFI